MKKLLLLVLFLGLIICASAWSAVLIGFGVTGGGETPPANTFYISAGLVPIDTGDTPTANTFYISAGLTPTDD